MTSAELVTSPTAQAVIVEAIKRRTDEIVFALQSLAKRELLATSELPGWSRLTIACHLRYGAEALLRITEDVIAGRETAFYPEGRDRQRPSTLLPRRGEAATNVVADLATKSGQLGEAWRNLPQSTWTAVVQEPQEAENLGEVTLGFYALLRLTEVEVHGGDLGVALSPWSEEFVSLALPARVAWLSKRRSNHRRFDATLCGSWVLSASDGDTYELTVRPGGQVSSRVVQRDTAGDAIVAGTRRQLLGLLLGRERVEDLAVSGDRQLALGFSRAFPGP